MKARASLAKMLREKKLFRAGEILRLLETRMSQQKPGFFTFYFLTEADLTFIVIASVPHQCLRLSFIDKYFLSPLFPGAFLQHVLCPLPLFLLE